MRSAIVVGEPEAAPAGGGSTEVAMLGRLILVAALVQALAACALAPTPEPTPTPATWTEPAAYSFVLLSQCGERSLIGRFRVRVEGHVTVGFERLDESAMAFQGTAEDLPTLGRLLDLASEARARGADVVNVTADPVDGHPTRVEIDWQAKAIDDEECYAVSDYAPG
jgi:hypothetical protein